MRYRYITGKGAYKNEHTRNEIIDFNVLMQSKTRLIELMNNLNKINLNDCTLDDFYKETTIDYYRYYNNFDYDCTYYNYDYSNFSDNLELDYKEFEEYCSYYLSVEELQRLYFDVLDSEDDVTIIDEIYFNYGFDIDYLDKDRLLIILDDLINLDNHFMDIGR